jgi:hypothetical protein
MGAPMGGAANMGAGGPCMDVVVNIGAAPLNPTVEAENRPLPPPSSRDKLIWFVHAIFLRTSRMDDWGMLA